MISAAVIAASQADWVSYWESSVSTNVPAPAGGPYLALSLRAVLSFICADNTTAVVRVPAPSTAMFLADGQTVDPAAPLSAAIITACIGALVSSTGSLATAFISGTLEAGGRQPL